MFTFTGKHPDWTVGGVATRFSLQTVGGGKRLQFELTTGESITYQAGNWTFWTSGTVAFQIDLDAVNAS